MNGENPFVPQLDQQEYLKRLKDAGYSGKQALGIMTDSGFDPMSVQADLIADYEADREKFLQEQNELKKQREAEMLRREQLEAERELREQFFEEEKKKNRPSASSDGSSPSVEAPDPDSELEAQLAALREEYEVDDPASPFSTSAPDILRNAMRRNAENSATLDQSYKNDIRAAEIAEVEPLKDSYTEAMQAKDYESAAEIKEKMGELGFEFTDYVEGGITLETHLQTVDQQFASAKRDLIIERNDINAALGLASSLNPDSDVDFSYLYDEAYERNNYNYKNSELGRYYAKVDKYADSVQRNLYDGFYGGGGIMEEIPYLGSVWRAGADVFKGAIQDFTVQFVTGSIGQIRMASDLGVKVDEAMGFRPAGAPDNAVTQGLNYLVRKGTTLKDILSRADELEAQTRGVGEEFTKMGFVEQGVAMFNGEMPIDQYLTATAQKTFQLIGNVRQYAKIYAAGKNPLVAAKEAAKKFDKARASDLVDDATALAMRNADDAVKMAKQGHRYNLFRIGGPSAGDTYNTLSARGDMTFAEKAAISAMVGTAEAVLSDVFSAADMAIANGRKAIVRQGVDNLRKQSKARLAELTKASAYKQGFKQGGKAAGGEFLEEFSIAVLQEGLPYIDDMLMGREPRDINVYNLIDAGIAGFLGAAPGSAMSGYASFQAHNSVLKERNYIRQKMAENQQRIDSEPDSGLRTEIENEQKILAARLMQVDDASMRSFDKLSEGQRRRLLKIHRDMAYTEDRLKSKDLSKEERAALENRYEALFAAKKRIEDQAESEPDFTRNDSPVKAQDASNSDSEITPKPQGRLERNNAELPSEADRAPQEQKEEEQQLSLFDETQEEKGAPTEDAPVAETEAPKEADAPKEAKAPKEPSKPKGPRQIDLGNGVLLDITNVDQVGEGEGRISLAAAIRANRLNNALGKKLAADGYKFLVYSREEFTEKFGEDSYGAVNHTNKTIAIAEDANEADVTEEFVHAAFRDIIGKDASSRQAIYQHLVSSAKGSSKLARVIREEIVDVRNNPAYQKMGEKGMQEEAIMGVLLRYVEDPALFEEKPSFINKFRALVNKMFAKNTDFKGAPIRNNEEFLKFARNVAAAARGEAVDVNQEVNIDTTAIEDAVIEEVTDEDVAEAENIQKDETLSEADKRAALDAKASELLKNVEGVVTPDSDLLSQEDIQDIDSVRLSTGRRKRKSEFTYLKDTEIFYREDPYAEIGDPSPQFERTRDKKIKVNDYFHFRNWYTHMTSNGRRPARVTQMYFMKDGKKYDIKPPKPKVDKDGNVLRINGAAHGKFAAEKRRQERQFDRAKEVNKLRNEVFELADTAEILKQAGLPPASGMSLIPGFDIAEFNKITDRSARFEFISKFRDAMFFERTLEEQREVLDIANENLQLLLDSGLSAEEVSQEQASEMLNMSGKTPSFMAQGGESMDMGNVRLSTGRRKKKGRVMTEEQTESWKNDVRKLFPGVPDSELFHTEEDLKEMDGAEAILIGYDRSSDKSKSGIIRQVSQMFGGRVVSSHRNPAMRDRVIRKMRAMVEKDRRSKNPKGFIVVAIGALDMGSLPGNPAVFSEIMLGYINEVEGQEKIDRINEVISSLSAGDIKGIYDASRARRSAGAIANRMSYENRPKSDMRVENEAEAEDFVAILSDVRNFSEAFTSFNSRANAAKKIIRQHILGIQKGEKGSTEKVLEYIAENHADQNLSDVPGASVITLMKVPYGKKGDRNDMFAVDTDSDAFPDAIASKTADRMKFLAKPIPVETAFSKATYTEEKDGKTTRKKVFTKKAEKEGKTLKYAKKRLGYGAESKISLDEETVSHHRLSTGRRKRKTWQEVEESGFQRWKNKWIKRLQDKYVDIFNLQDEVAKQSGPLNRSQDFRMAEELMYGKAAEDLAKLDQRIEKITAEMKKAGIKVDELSEYLYALHAKERNALVSLRSNGAVTDGSGMTDAEADAILRGANKKALDPIVSMIREIQKDTRETMVKYGLETRETINAFENMFDDYVPLAGLSMDETVKSPYPTGGAGMNVFGPTTKKASGRKSKAENILAQIVAQNASIHIKARTNEAMQTLHNLVKENPNPKVWRILDENAGVDSSSPNVVAVRIGGKQKFIYFNDPSYAYSLKGMGIPQSNAFVRALRKPAQWLRASFTTLNPEFFISNFSRDIQSAVFNAAAEADIEGGMMNSKKTIGRMMKLVPGTLRTLIKNSVQKGGDPAIEKYFQEFKEDGGKTGWAYAKSLDQIASELEGATGDKTRTQEILGKAKNFGETIEGINDAFENSIRLSAYIAAREAGVSREKAAQLAKNITVNFNKQGEWGPTLNAVYLFFNASVQGTARLGRSLTSLKAPVRPDGTKRSGVERVNTAQWMAGGLALFSSMLTALGYAMSDEDEDGTLFWDKIPDYVKERNLIIMRPNGKDYFKIPMPYGYNVFANMGTAMTESAYGKREADESMMFIFNSFFSSFSPISFGQSEDLFTAVGKGAVPTVMKPFVEVMVNETYFGSPVTGENLPFGVQKPQSELSFRSPEAVKEFFQWMNEATGGSEYKSGGLDFNPDKIWYMFEYYIGSAGQFLNRSVKVPRKLISKFSSGEEIDIEANEIPLARILYGEPSKYFDMEKFKDNQQEFESLYKELRNGIPFDRGRHQGIGKSMSSVLRSHLKELKFLRQKKREARKLPYAERTAMIQKLRNRERQVVMRFNKLYERARQN